MVVSFLDLIVVEYIVLCLQILNSLLTRIGNQESSSPVFSKLELELFLQTVSVLLNQYRPFLHKADLVFSTWQCLSTDTGEKEKVISKPQHYIPPSLRKRQEKEDINGKKSFWTKLKESFDYESIRVLSCLAHINPGSYLCCTRLSLMNFFVCLFVFVF
jgi:hypothetical protein